MLHPYLWVHWLCWLRIVAWACVAPAAHAWGGIERREGVSGNLLDDSTGNSDGFGAVLQIQPSFHISANHQTAPLHQMPVDMVISHWDNPLRWLRYWTQ